MFKKIIPALMSVAFLSSANAGSISKPPTNIPISFQKIGQIYSFDVDVIEQSNYSVKIKFYLTLPNKWSHFFDKESPEQSRRLYEILGRATLTNNKKIDLGVPAKFRVQIYSKSKNLMILDEIVERPTTGSTYMGRYAVLTTNVLPVGIYSVRVHYLQGSPELAQLHAKVSLAKAHHGK